MTVVLDASVLLKWFMEEPGSEAALSLKRRHLEGALAIAIPDLAVYEVPNVLRFKRGIPEAEVKAAMQAFWRLDLEIVAPTEPLLDDAVLITADAHLHRAASKLVRTTSLH